MLDAAGRCHHHARAAVVAVEIGPDRLAIETVTVSGVPRMRAADRLAGEGRLAEQVEDEIVGRILDGADLLQDDVLLALQLVGIEHRIGQDVGRGCRGRARCPP